MAQRALAKYRLRCLTEGVHVYTWSESSPTSCPNAHDHEIDPISVVQLDRISADYSHVTNLPLTPYDRVKTSEDTVLINLRPGSGLSALRDIVTTQNGGTVVSEIDAPVITLSVAGEQSRATLRSAERTRFLAGACGEVSIGGHLPSPLVDDQTLKFGLFDDDNGYFFELTSSGMYVAVRNSGDTRYTPRAAFNLDCLDGQGPSGHMINPFKGYIWTISFSMFGYGCVEWAIVAEDSTQQQRSIPMHRFFAQHEPSVAVPNLPINVELASGTSDAQCTTNVTARKFSVQGKFTPMTREGSHFVTTTSQSTGWTPITSMRRDPTQRFVPVKLYAAHVFCETGISTLKIKAGASGAVTGSPVWTAPACHDPSETAVEVCDDPEAAVDIGTCLFKEFVREANVTIIEHDIDHFVTDEQVITLYVHNPAAIGTVHACLKWIEEW